MSGRSPSARIPRDTELTAPFQIQPVVENMGHHADPRSRQREPQAAGHRLVTTPFLKHCHAAEEPDRRDGGFRQTALAAPRSGEAERRPVAGRLQPTQNRGEGPRRRPAQGRGRRRRPAIALAESAGAIRRGPAGPIADRNGAACGAPDKERSRKRRDSRGDQAAQGIAPRIPSRTAPR